jgi:alkylation response protein AidB-like acyl-CoA dehydrogenase
MNLDFSYSDEDAARSEQIGKLDPDGLATIHREKLFRLFLPKSLDGLGCSLPQGLVVEESLARMDGSLGWVVTLCAGAGWFIGFMDKEMQSELAAEPKLCLAGSGFVGGKAEKIDEFYHISGSWTYASGALHASHFTANCELLENGQPILDKRGAPTVKAFILKKEEIQILDGWNYMGMVATGSHAFKADSLIVPLFRCFEIVPEKVTLPDPIYRYPFLQFAEATLAANILGITGHFQELVEAAVWKRQERKSFTDRELSYFEKSFKKELARISDSKKKFYEAVNESWGELEQDGRISLTKLRNVSRMSRKLTQACRISNAALYPFAGLEGAKTHTELNRVWRDFNTVSQHALLIFPF